MHQKNSIKPYYFRVLHYLLLIILNVYRNAVQLQAKKYYKTKKLLSQYKNNMKQLKQQPLNLDFQKIILFDRILILIKITKNIFKSNITFE